MNINKMVNNTESLHIYAQARAKEEVRGCVSSAAAIRSGPSLQASDVWQNAFTRPSDGARCSRLRQVFGAPQVLAALVAVPALPAAVTLDLGALDSEPCWVLEPSLDGAGFLPPAG